MYFNNHVHDEYSNAALGFPDVVNKVEDVIQKSYDLGLLGISITNHECLSSHIKALQYYQKMKKDRPFKIALGNEIYLMDEKEDEANRAAKNTIYPYYHFILTALDEVGYQQIRELSSLAWGRAYFSRGIMRTPTYYADVEKIIKRNTGHIIASTACLGGFLDRMILKWKNGEETAKLEIHAFITWCIEVFGKNNFFLEIQPCEETNQEQLIVNKAMIDLSKAYNLKIIPTTDAHYLTKESSFIHKIYLNSKEGDREVDSFYATTYLMDEKELRQFLRILFTDEEIDILYENTKEIFNKINEYNLKHNPIIPQIPENKLPNFKIEHTFSNYYSKYNNFAYYANPQRILHEQYFFYQIEKGIKEKICTNSKKENLEKYIARLDEEFEQFHLISEELGTSIPCYFSSMSKIIDIIWEAGSLVMPGRGSAGACLSCYLLNITQIDPLPFGEYMPFWRFMNIDRGVELPDIDTDSESSKKNEIIQGVVEYFGEDRVLSIATFSALTSKTAIEKSCKGLGINNDVADYIKSMIPVERGFTWSLRDCLEGNVEKQRQPIQSFIREVEKYPKLKECALSLEGLITGRSTHAAGILVGNDSYTNYIASVRSPKGELCSCYDLIDSEYCGEIKFDLLKTIATDKIHTTLNLLLKDGIIEWQGTLKKTYEKYIHPDILEYDDKNMWDIIKNIYSVFQFDTKISERALNLTQPHSVMDLSATNNLLRLMAQPGQESPLLKYARFKQNINDWYEEMTSYGLNENEQACLKEYLNDSYGLADSQEKLMRISMDKRVSGYTLKESNKLRKSIAKKSAQLQEEAKKQFFEYGEKLGTRKLFLEYIWNVIFAASFGYSFSQIHSASYSIIALQELNLNYYYPPVYWNCACLTVESQSDDEKDKRTAIDYGKMARSIYKMKHHGINILPPSINKSNISFTPNREDNSILFGLGGISGISNEVAREIVNNRPYDSFIDFYNKIKNNKESLIKKQKIITLIKAGCFDEFNENRIETMKEFFSLEYEEKKELSLQNINKILEYDIYIPENLLTPYMLCKNIKNKMNFYKQDEKIKTKKHYMVPKKVESDLLYWFPNLKEDVDFYYENDYMIIIDKNLDRATKPYAEKIKQYISNEDFIKNFNNIGKKILYENNIGENNELEWAFSSTSFYPKDQHELMSVNFDKYNIINFDLLPEDPSYAIKSYKKRNGEEFVWKQYDLYRICGTVVDKNKNKRTIEILTPQNKVISVKFNDETYSYYEQRISQGDIEHKVMVDDSWFKRGTKLCIVGYRNNDYFRAKKYKNSIFKHTVLLIEKVSNNADLIIRSERKGV